MDHVRFPRRQGFLYVPLRASPPPFVIQEAPEARLPVFTSIWWAIPPLHGADLWGRLALRVTLSRIDLWGT
jgi:hypothetical protein